MKQKAVLTDWKSLTVEWASRQYATVRWRILRDPEKGEKTLKIEGDVNCESTPLDDGIAWGDAEYDRAVRKIIREAKLGQ